MGAQEEPIVPVIDEPDTTPIDAPPAEAGSVWERLRAEHQQITEGRQPLELDVPGMGLVIRYRYVPLREATKGAERLRKLKGIGDQALYSSIDTLILACDEILARQPGDGELVALTDPGDAPIRFDERLARGMGWEPDGAAGYSARTICRRLFGNDYALIQQAQQVSEWMADTSQDAGEEFLGE